jgi:hypothetical protein
VIHEPPHDANVFDIARPVSAARLSRSRRGADDELDRAQAAARRRDLRSLLFGCGRRAANQLLDGVGARKGCAEFR